MLIVASLEESPLETPALQVPGLLGELLRKYEALGGYEQLLYGRLPVDGSDAAEVAEIVYGDGDPRQALLVDRPSSTAPRIVTLQVHFPPSTADTNRPLALAILDSLADPSAEHADAQHPSVVHRSASCEPAAERDSTRMRVTLGWHGLRRPGGSWPGSAGQRCLG